MSSFGTLWQEVRTSIGERTDIDTIIKTALNDAVIDLTMTFRIRQAIASDTLITSAGVSKYELKDNCIDVITVRNDTDAELLSPGDYLEYASLDHEDVDSLGTPLKWFVDADDIYLYSNTPDDSSFEITYRYVKRFSDMSDDTDLFPLPREWERPAKLFAKSYVFELLGQNDKALRAYQQGTAIAGSRKKAGAWSELLRGDNRIHVVRASYSDEGY